ncbi:MAG: hypothetical protein CMF25_00110 [Kangiellaceae bacterium]|nr:hypothetical protein [Kangiellaceae bacterium]
MGDRMTLTPEQRSLSEKLTRLQRVTVLALVGQPHLSQREAYYMAGGRAKSPEAADVIVSRMLSDVKVKAFYHSLCDTAATQAIMSRSEALVTLSCIARNNVTDLLNFGKRQVGVDEQGNPVYQATCTMKDEEQISPELAASIAELSTSGDGLRFKMHSQLQAIRLLGQMLGWFERRAKTPGRDPEQAVALPCVENSEQADNADAIYQQLFDGEPM